MSLKLITIMVSVASLLFVSPVIAEYAQKLDVQVRLDERSGRDTRLQYRSRYYPSFALNSDWSVHGFVVTGNDFASSHNTLSGNQSHYVYVRRLFMRHQGAYGKSEFGILPTYKGRVSSSGLSKDGWIMGARHVSQLANNSQIEVVIGQLDNLDPSKALRMLDDVDYIEVEYSARMDKRNSYEVSFERMTQSNFLRTEMRHKFSPNVTLFGELVQRLDEYKVKAVLGLEGEFVLANIPIEYFAHYSYVSNGFGLRAELTEDFLGFGNGISAELSADLGDTEFGWFVRFDTVDSQSRLLAGLSWSL